MSNAYDAISSARLVPPKWLDPLWRPDEGFLVVVSWKCGCTFEGWTTKPTTFRKTCPVHRAVVDLIMVAADHDQMHEFMEEPGYPDIPDEVPEANWFEARLWPRGTFDPNSPLSARRALRVQRSRRRSSSRVNR